MPFNYYSKIFFVCAMFFLSSIFLSCSVEARKVCHNNYATIHFFYWPEPAIVDLSYSFYPHRMQPSIQSWGASEGQGCGGPVGMMGYNWNYRGDTGTLNDRSLSITGVPNKIKLLYHCGRHKTEEVSESFLQYSMSNPVLGLELYVDDSHAANYMPHKMNFNMSIGLDYLRLYKDPMSKKDKIYVEIPQLIFGQSSEGGLHFKTKFDIMIAMAKTTYKLAGGIGGGSGLAKSYSNLIRDLFHIKAHKNNWYVSQASLQDGTRTAYMAEFMGSQAFVAFARDLQTHEKYPIFIVPGKDEHHFDAWIVTDKTEKAPKEGSLEASPHKGNNQFLHASLGPFKRYAGTRWIESSILGWLYPEEYDSEDDLRWIYRRESDSWILIHRQAPQYIYRELANRIFKYDPQKMEFVVDREAWDSSETLPGLPPKPEKPEEFDPSSLK